MVSSTCQIRVLSRRLFIEQVGVLKRQFPVTLRYRGSEDVSVHVEYSVPLHGVVDSLPLALLPPDGIIPHSQINGYLHEMSSLQFNIFQSNLTFIKETLGP
ncbi:unnamed protein product [Colias eurytheme]|nr:unnamed protein product [Colias eurytheme]